MSEAVTTMVDATLVSNDPRVAHADHITGHIGNTPMVRLTKLFGGFEVLAKLELLNPTQSMKDRTAFHILSSAERDGTLQPGATIIESSSGNFGLSVALFGNIRNYPVICAVDPRLMPYYQRMFRILGVEGRVVDEMENGSYQLARIRAVKDLAARIPGSFVPNQYDNPRNAEAHYLFTGGEMLRQVEDRRIDYLVVGISTGGTLTGIARRILERFPQCKVVAVDAVGSPLFDPVPKPRMMTGLGSNYSSANLDRSLISEVVLVNDLEAAAMARALTRREGIFAGVSSGAVVAAICKLRSRIAPGSTVVTLFPDSGNRYIETFYDDTWVSEHLRASASELERTVDELEKW